MFHFSTLLGIQGSEYMGEGGQVGQPLTFRPARARHWRLPDGQGQVETAVGQVE